jgi:hypothetical protein
MLIAPEIPRHKAKWTKSMSFGTSWDLLVETMRSFAQKRPAYVMSHLKTKFGLSGTATLTIKTNKPGAGKIVIEEMTMPDSIKLEYFKNIPLKFTAVPESGYKFAGWKGISNLTSDTMHVSMNSDGEITALFEPDNNSFAENSENAPNYFELAQNYPNPFNPSTTISFRLPADGNVILKVYDILGSEVASLINRNMISGWHKISFNASDLKSGVYLYRIQSGKYSQSKKMVVLK